MLNQRSKSPEKEFSQNNLKKYFGVYIGFVTDSDDTTRNAGRLTVWIPDISVNKENTFVVQYCSFFAGASNIDNVTVGSKTQAQQSYGWWGVPPDINNMVVVSFINGDPARGIWFGCLYQEYMTNMVPNIPESATTDTSVPTAPTLEYNKKDPTNADTDNPARPIYTPLYNALVNQGLFDDNIRGPAQFKQTGSDGNPDALSSKQNIQGMLTPGGSQFVLDDSTDNKHIRLRTANGTQLIINDTVGFIYLITRSGNSWLEISDDGINAYSTNDISFRSQANINFHADGNINMNAVGNMNIATNSNVVLQADKNIEVLSGLKFTMGSGGDVGIISDSNISIKGNVLSSIGNSIALSASSQIGVNSSGNLYLQGSQIQQNNGSGPTAITPAKATGISPSSHTDVDNNLKTGYASMSTKTIVNVLPSHEPWSGHQSTSTTPTSTAVNTTVSTVSNADSSAVQKTISTDTTTSTTTTDTSASSDVWLIPVTGTVNSLYGNRGAITGLHVSNFHPGVDISKNNSFPIYASRAGTIIYSNIDKKPYTGYGNCVVIDHGDGYKSIYGHMSVRGVSFGDKVSQGQQIGNVGMTGMATGPHCHFEIRKNTTKINPSTIFPALGIVGSKVTALTKSKTANT